MSNVIELHCVNRAWLNCRSQVWRILFLLLLTISVSTRLQHSRNQGMAVQPSSVCCEMTNETLHILSSSAEQTRRVFCSGGGGRDDVLEEKFCEAVLKPKASRRCSNKRCRGRWKVGKWSQVTQCDDIHTLYCFKKMPTFSAPRRAERAARREASSACGGSATRRRRGRWPPRPRPRPPASARTPRSPAPRGFATRTTAPSHGKVGDKY